MNRMPRAYNFIDFPPLTEEQKSEISELVKMNDSEIDTSDIPENSLSNGQFYYANALKIKKEKISTNIDKDNLEWLKSAGKGYQTRLNGVIRWARMNGCPIAQM